MSTYQAKDRKPETSRFFGMFASRSSAGKSTAAFSFPKPILVLDTDLRQGYLGSEFLDLNQITIETFPPMESTWLTVEKKLESLYMMFKSGQRPYNTIIIDSITTMVRLFMNDSTKMRDKQGQFTLSAPVDYKFESQVTLSLFDILRSLPCNIIISGHLINVWGKDPNDDNEYAPRVIIGKELSIRHALGENLLIYFDEVYEFSKSDDGLKHFVQFRTSVARTVFSKLPNGQQNITGKLFYPYWLSQVEKSMAVAVASGEIKK